MSRIFQEGTGGRRGRQEPPPAVRSQKTARPGFFKVLFHHNPGFVVGPPFFPSLRLGRKNVLSRDIQ